MRLLLLLCLLCFGCATPFNDLDGRIKKEYRHEKHATVDSVKSHYFTTEANELIKDIPCVDGLTIGGSWVSGANFWTKFLGVLSGVGTCRKCVMSEEAVWNWGPESIVHEYLHHIDSIGRDGGPKLIDLDEFRVAYVKLYNDRRWFGLFLYTERRADRWVTDTFGIGDLSEYIAYIGARLAIQQSGPDYMWKVFRKVLRFHGKKVGAKGS